MKEKKILWIDWETTGLDPNKHAGIQLAMIMDIDGEGVDEVQINFKPNPSDLIEGGEGVIPKVWRDIDLADSFILPITGINVQELRSYKQPITVSINAFLQKHISKYDNTDKAYIGGYNVPFDIAFLSKFYEKCGDKYLGSYINWIQIDVRSCLYLSDYEGKIHLDNYKLATVCEHFGIDLKAHNPMSDIKATRKLFYLWRETNGLQNTDEIQGTEQRT